MLQFDINRLGEVALQGLPSSRELLSISGNILARPVRHVLRSLICHGHKVPLPLARDALAPSRCQPQAHFRI